jgi:acetyl esterase/lipase
MWTLISGAVAVILTLLFALQHAYVSFHTLGELVALISTCRSLFCRAVSPLSLFVLLCQQHTGLGFFLWAVFHFVVVLPLQRVLCFLPPTSTVGAALQSPTREFGFRAQFGLDCTRYVMHHMDEAAQQRLYIKEAALSVKKLRTPPVHVQSRMHGSLLQYSLWLCGPTDGRAAPVDNAAGERVLIFCHGGGFAVGHAAMWADFCQQLHDEMLRAPGGGMVLRVLSLSHPLSVSYTPDAKKSSLASDNDSALHGFQRNLATTFAAFEYLTEELGVPSERIAIAGDSSGGNIALSTCIALRDRARVEQKLAAATASAAAVAAVRAAQPAACVLISPHTNLSSSAYWRRRHLVPLCGFAAGVSHYLPADSNIDYLNERVESIWARRYVDNSARYAREAKERGDEPRRRGTPEDEDEQVLKQQASHPLISPIYAELTQLPPTFLSYGGREVLSVDIRAFAEKLRTQAGPAAALTELCYSQGAHDYLLLPDIFGEASKVGTRAVAAFLCKQLRGRN